MNGWLLVGVVLPLLFLLAVYPWIEQNGGRLMSRLQTLLDRLDREEGRVCVSRLGVVGTLRWLKDEWKDICR